MHAGCWVLLTDDFNLHHETIVTIGTIGSTGSTGSIVTEQTLQTGPAFTACQTATNLQLRENLVTT